jgi:hypothetical protein
MTSRIAVRVIRGYAAWLAVIALLIHTGIVPILIQTADAAQGTDPAYLGEMPTVEQVRGEIKGTDAMDTAARLMGAFWQLRQIIEAMAGPRLYRNQLTSDEKRLQGEYIAAYQAAAQPYAYIQNATSHPDKPKWYQMHAFYETDDSFRDDLLTRFFSPTFRAEYSRVTGQQLARAVARSEASTTMR